MKIHELHVTGKKSRKRVGRGDASGLGTTSGRGDNGQNSRSGGRVSPGFEGGQTPLSKRIPKTRGFKKAKQEWTLLHTDQLNQFSKDSQIDTATLTEKGLISHHDQPIKLLYRGDVTSAVNVYVDAASRNARTAVENAGGTVTLGSQG